jgi:putative MATE family efflux protein
MGGGVASAIARALGAGDKARAEAAVLHALLIALGLAAVYTLLFAVFARPLFAPLGGEGAALDAAVAYAEVLFGGAAVICLANTLAAVLRGTGNMAVPAGIMITTAVLDIGLSGALTLGWAGLPALGVRGPAVAFVAMSAIAAVAMLAYLASARSGFGLRLGGVALSRGLFADILRVGAVACGNALLTIATIVVVTGLVGRYGTAALAGYGLGSRLELMLIPISFGVGGALTALVGANRGSRRFARARRIAWVGGLAVFAVTGAIGVLVGIVPDLWIGLFTADPAAVEFARLYLRIAGPFYGFFGLGMTLYFATQGTGNMVWPFTAGVVRMAVAAGIGAALALWFGAPVGWLFACVALGLVLFGGLIAVSLLSRLWNPRDG